MTLLLICARPRTRKQSISERGAQFSPFAQNPPQPKNLQVRIGFTLGRTPLPLICCTRLTHQMDDAARLEGLLQELEAMTPRLAAGVKLANAQRLQQVAMAFKFAEGTGEVGNARRSKGVEHRKKRVHLTLEGRRFIDSYYHEYIRRWPRDGRPGGAGMNHQKRAERWSFIANILSAALERKEELSSANWDADTIMGRINSVVRGNVELCADVSDGRGIEHSAIARSLVQFCACAREHRLWTLRQSSCGGVLRDG